MVQYSKGCFHFKSVPNEVIELPDGLWVETAFEFRKADSSVGRTMTYPGRLGACSVSSSSVLCSALQVCLVQPPLPIGHVAC